MQHNPGPAAGKEVGQAPPRPLQPARLLILGAGSGAVLAGSVGGVILAAIWIVGSPQGARRAILWASLHGVLIGAAGLGTGAFSGVAVISLAPHLTRRGHAVALGAALGAVLGGGLGALVWEEAAGQPVALASLLANTLAGAIVALFARHSLRT